MKQMALGTIVHVCANYTIRFQPHHLIGLMTTQG